MHGEGNQNPLRRTPSLLNCTGRNSAEGSARIKCGVPKLLKPWSVEKVCVCGGGIVRYSKTIRIPVYFLYSFCYAFVNKYHSLLVILLFTSSSLWVPIILSLTVCDNMRHFKYSRVLNFNKWHISDYQITQLRHPDYSDA